jgi:hypothetical protein
MSEIKVPEGMLEAAQHISVHPLHTLKIIQAALRWQRTDWLTAPNAERMPEPWYSNSRKKWEKFHSQWKRVDDIDFVDLLIFFVTRYLERYDALPEPEVPEAIKDLQFADIPSQRLYTISQELANERILEAYRRGFGSNRQAQKET